MKDPRFDVTVLGEALVDIVRTPAGAAESPGGSPANVALALSRLGRRTRLVTSLGDDLRGRRVREWLEASGVQVAAGRASGHRTSTAIADLDESGSATYVFDIGWELPDVPLHETAVIHTGSIGAFLRPGADDVETLVERARAHSVITYDPNVRPTLIADADADDVRRRVERLVRLADVVKASADDVAWLYPDAAPTDIAESWRALGPAFVVITDGAEGSFASHPSARARTAAVPVGIVDTVGAGDTFMAALIDGLLEHAGASSADALRRGIAQLSSADVTGLLERAARAAAVTVSRPGADPPWRGELLSASTPGGR